jgi:hypothetical protein
MPSLAIGAAGIKRWRLVILTAGYRQCLDSPVAKKRESLVQLKLNQTLVAFTGAFAESKHAFLDLPSHPLR